LVVGTPAALKNWSTVGTCSPEKPLKTRQQYSKPKENTGKVGRPKGFNGRIKFEACFKYKLTNAVYQRIAHFNSIIVTNVG
jgi:hypothetical protein